MKKKVLYILLFFLYLSGINTIFSLESFTDGSHYWKIFHSNHYVSIDNIKNDQWVKSFRTNNPYKPDEHHHIWYQKKILNTEKYKHPAIFMDVRRLTRIYFDKKEVYRFGNENNSFFPGWNWVTLTVPHKKNVELSIYQYSPTKNIGFHTFRFGEKNGILNNLTNIEMSRFLIGFFVAMSGFIVLLLALLYSRDKMLIYFSGFSITSGLYHVSTVHALGFLWISNEYFWPYLMYASMYFMPVFLLLYFELIIGRGKWQITRIFIWAHTVYAIGAMGLIAFKIVHMEDTMGYAQSFFIITIAVHLIRMSISLITRHEKEIILLSTGVIIFLLLSLWDLVFARLTASPVNNISHFSIFIFDFFLVFIIIRRFRLMQLRLKSYSESLEEKISERTMELKKVIDTLEEDIEQARVIQQKLLPPSKIDIPGMQIEYLYRPMSQVGGDFIDFYQMGEKQFRILLADATGHGIQAALLTMALKTDYEALKRKDIEVDEIMRLLNESFYQKYQSLDSFFTAVLFDINLSEKKYRMVSAGHPNQYYVSENFYEELERTGPLVGIKPHVEYKIIPGNIESDSIILLTTDGLLEQENKSGKTFQREKFFELIKKPHLWKENFIDLLKNEFDHFHEGVPQYDDVTVISIRFRQIE